MTALPTATVVIVSKNRRDELRVAIRSAVTQTAAVEVLVVDDASTDDTTEMVTREFPQVRVIRFPESSGCVVRRNQAAELATGAIVFSIDDDAAFVHDTTVEQTLAEFDDPRIGAVAIPFIEPNKSGQLLQRAPDTSKTWATDSFIGTAHALRKDLFLALGGYPGELVHQGEERDYCLRMLAAGYVVRLGTAPPIDHYESPKRDLARVDFFGRRNDLLFAWKHVPPSLLPAHLIGTTINGLRTAWSSPNPGRAIAGMTQGFVEILRGRQRREPVSLPVYRLHRRLKKSGPLPLTEVVKSLPAGDEVRS